jgi:hypothetical protein
VKQRFIAIGLLLFNLVGSYFIWKGTRIAQPPHYDQNCFYVPDDMDGRDAVTQINGALLFTSERGGAVCVWSDRSLTMGSSTTIEFPPGGTLKIQSREEIEETR